MDIFWLSCIQGVSEFLPISSSGHLFLAEHFFGLQSVGRLTEVLLNFATLFVVFLYFRHDVKHLLCSLKDVVRGYLSPQFHQGLKICTATLPVVIVGFLVNQYIDHLTHSLRLFGTVSILTGFLMLLADKWGKTHTTYERLSYRKAFMIGLFQTGAFIPGASRLGLSLTAARFLGCKRVDAARFSFLTSLPVGIGAFTLLLKSAIQSGFFHMGFDWFIVLLTCFFIGYCSLYLFMWWLRRHTLLFFGIYRILLGAFVLFYAHA